MRYLREDDFPAFAIDGSTPFMGFWNPEAELGIIVSRPILHTGNGFEKPVEPFNQK